MGFSISVGVTIVRNGTTRSQWTYPDQYVDSEPPDAQIRSARREQRQPSAKTVCSNRPVLLPGANRSAKHVEPYGYLR